jgi:large subunit ribosomal protein L30
MLKIVLKRSYIGVPEKHKKILAALGLKKIGSSVLRAESKSIEGMIRRVSHLISVQRVSD